MKIGIIVPFYDGHQWINKLVESFDHAAADYDCVLYIIDNSPENKPVKFGDPLSLKVEVIREKPGIGYGKACNRGYQICKDQGYDYLIIANQDGYVSSNFIKELLYPFQQDDQIMITAPLLRTYSGNQIEDFFVKYYFSQAPALISDLMDGTQKDYYEMSRISGACFAFDLRNKHYRYSYFFDPLFHMYYEDEDLCHRIKQIGGKIVLVSPNAMYYHQHSHTTDLANQKEIQSDKLVSEKILRLKDSSKNSMKSLYGIFVTTTTSFTYHILRGEFKKCFMHISSFWIILFKMPAILRSRRLDLSYINS